MPSLLVLAAGMGSRYGGLKQLDSFGPSGETILDYSVYDAWRSGFERVVFLIRRDFENAFDDAVTRRLEGVMEIKKAYQELADLPAGHRKPEARNKPWGTTHAVWAARKAIQGPFAVVNADDFYGVESFRQVNTFLSDPTKKPGEYCMAGYAVKQTLSKRGPVTRGICKVDRASFLSHIVESKDVEQAGDLVLAQGRTVSPESPVSMNFWGFQDDVFGHLEKRLDQFLTGKGQAEKAECLLPDSIGDMVQEETASVKVLPGSDHWFGVTFPEDKQAVRYGIQGLVASGHYPALLWGPVTKPLSTPGTG